MNEKLLLAKELVSKWLELNTYHHSINDIEDLGIMVSYSEFDPCGNKSNNYFIIKNRRIINSNGDDVIDLALDASDDIDFKNEIKKYENFLEKELNMKETIITKESNLKEWYLKEFPTDEVGKTLKNITFKEAYDSLHLGSGFYDVLGGTADSLVRERIFTMLSKLYGCSYNDIYDIWLGDD